MDKFEYTGHLHIHSTFSDGSGSIQEIVSFAQQADLDFVGITDHNTLAALKEGWVGRHHGVVVLVGIELNTVKNHYIAFGLQEEGIPPDNEDPQRIIDAVNAQGGFGYLAHPLEKSNPLFMGGRSFPWDKMEVENFAGVEIWNFSSLWRSAFSSMASALFWYYVDIYRGARWPDPQGLELWDRLNRERPVFGFAGSDAHSFPLQIGPLKLHFFHYNFLFRTLNTHVVLNEKLSEDSREAVKQLLTALRCGDFFVGSDYVHSARGFRFSALNYAGDEEVHMCGRIHHSPTTVLRIVSPSRRGLIRLLKNGKVVYQTRQQVLAFKVLEPGVFRAEVYWCPRLGKPRPWIYSNPIHVLP